MTGQEMRELFASVMRNAQRPQLIFASAHFMWEHGRQVAIATAREGVLAQGRNWRRAKREARKAGERYAGANPRPAPSYSTNRDPLDFWRDAA